MRKIWDKEKTSVALAALSTKPASRARSQR
jgi:hypothetical protein